MSKLKRKYTLDKDYEQYNLLFNDVVFKSRWLSIKGGKLTIKKGYSWDGCSPKYKVFGLVIGTPDGNKDQLKYVSLVHDVLCQKKRKLPFTKKQVNGLFYKMMTAKKWKLAKLYLLAVNIKLKARDFGGYNAT